METVKKDNRAVLSERRSTSEQRRTFKFKRLVCQWTDPRLAMVTKAATTAALAGPVVPETLKLRLKRLMRSYPNGISLKDFKEAFAERFQQYIAYRDYGFDSIENLIKSVPDVLCVQHGNVKSVNSPQLERPPSDSGSEDTGKKTFSIINWDYLNKQREEAKEKEKRRKEEQEKEMTPMAREELATKSETEDQQQLEKKQNKKSLHTMKTRQDRRWSMLSQPYEKRLEIPPKIAATVEQLLWANRKGVWVSKFLMEYRKYHGVTIDASDWGFSSIVDVLHSLPCSALVEQPMGSGDWLVYLRGTKPPKVSSNRVIVPPSAGLSEQWIGSIHRLLQDNIEGIAMEKFAKAFKHLFGDDLPMAELGFNSMFELLVNVPGLEMVWPPGEHSVMVYSTNPPPFEEKKRPEKPIKKKSEAAADWKKRMGKPQPSVYSKVPLSEACMTCYQTVYVSHVISPGEFYVQFVGTQTSEALEGLQQDMTNFYSSYQGHSYTVEDVYPGFPCCAPFEVGWYRAEVEDLVSPDGLLIRYVDYGNVIEIPMSAIRHAKANYLTLPAQAVKCCLSNLEPAGHIWSLKAKVMFSKMTTDKPLTCTVTSVKDRLMSLIMVDTTTECEVAVGDFLVAQSLAIKVQEEEMSGKLETPFVTKEGELPQVRLPKKMIPIPGSTIHP